MIFAQLCWQALARLAPLAVIASASAAFAQTGEQASGRAVAEVVTPIRAVPLSDLSFGSVVIGAAGEGSVAVAADGSPPRYHNATRSSCAGEARCMPHRASFDVSGEPRRSYRVVLPEQVIAYGVKTGAGLVVGSLDMRSINAAASQGEGRLDNHGRDSFFVGGVLQVPAGTNPDVFRAELPVIVTYN